MKTKIILIRETVWRYRQHHDSQPQHIQRSWVEYLPRNYWCRDTPSPSSSHSPQDLPLPLNQVHCLHPVPSTLPSPVSSPLSGLLHPSFPCLHLVLKSPSPFCFFFLIHKIRTQQDQNNRCGVRLSCLHTGKSFPCVLKTKKLIYTEEHTHICSIFTTLEVTCVGEEFQ